MPDRPTPGPHGDRIAQAIELIRAQVGCDLDRAFDLLRERALLLDQTLEYTALDVLDNIVRFDSVMLHWYAIYSNPSGPSTEPWYAVNQGHAYRSTGHPRGVSPLPMFRIVDHDAYPTRFHPDGEATDPWFTIRGSMVYPADGHPGGASHAPWYQAR